MNVQDDIAATIYRAIDDVNAQLPPASRLKKDPSTVLFGREGGLDSLSLVNLIVALEQHVEIRHGKVVSLSSPDVLLAENSPFASVEALTSYLASRVQEG